MQCYVTRATRSRLLSRSVLATLLHHLSFAHTTTCPSSSASASLPFQPPHPPHISSGLWTMDPDTGLFASESTAVREEMESLDLSDATAPSSFPSFLEPPSYADVILKSTFEPQNAGSGSYPLRAAASDYLRIVVSDPETVQEVANSLVPGGTTYITYPITTWVRAAGHGGPSEFRVRRRFRDDVTLAARLAEAYRGYFIPQRPDKSVVDDQVMQKHEFVEQRRWELEKYLRRLAEHPVIGRSEELRVMLDGAVRLPKQLFGDGAAGRAAPEDVVQPAKEGRDLLRILKELKQAVTNDWGGVKLLVVAEDRELLERKEKMQDLEQQLCTGNNQS
ncbi:hypothetical protein B296_00043446 [Ensete ventricosum]|uniref:PX domain-containing protein n=1 Tax=Ensete ventricosum TaxID=4639 RepID=A0A426XG44_ENSVE|nr:hypothetical protein B296_00043446 [Ensete ventricosum]